MTQFFKTSDAVIELKKEFPSTNAKELKAWLPYLKHGVDFIDKRLPSSRKAKYEWNVEAIARRWKLLPEHRLAKKLR
jgi:hypothetical protein